MKSEMVHSATIVSSPPSRGSGVTRVLRVLARHSFLGALRGRGHLPSPVQVREALEELGVVYLKFGQVLALRRDLLPPSYIAELEKLTDRLPPVEFTAIRDAIERELGQPLAELFASIDEAPMAAATIAQVHTAELHDGRHVIVKVRRPDVESRVAADIPTLAHVAGWLERLQPTLRGLDLPGMVREFRDSLTREMDLALEAHTIARFRASLVDTPELWIPAPITEFSTRGVLVEEFSPGERIDNYADAHPESRHRLARAVAKLALHQVFETGLFHADPHPGNLYVLPDSRLCLHDFGMIGEIDDQLRTALGEVLEATVGGDASAAAEAYIEMGMAAVDVDRDALAADLKPVVRRVHDQPLAEISIGATLEALLKVGGQHRLRNPGEILLLTRAVLITEALLKRLDPAVSIVALFKEEIPRIAASRFTGRRLLAHGKQVARDLEQLLADAPHDVRLTLRRIAKGELGRVRVPDLETAAAAAGRDIERLTGGVTSAALLIAGALLGTTSGWHRLIGDTLLAVGLVGTIAVAAGALLKRRVH
ncbi:MAG: AarF/UbiB family protein [Gemmatimonadaceae bacterium]